MNRHDVANVVASIAREFPFDSDDVEARVRKQVKARPGQLDRDRRPNLVLEIDGAFAGYASVKPFEIGDDRFLQSRDRGMTAVLVQVTVEPQFRGQQGGLALTKAAIDGCRDAGYAQVMAHIIPEHAGFYRKLGFDVPAAGAGWSWVEKHTVDDLNLLNNLDRHELKPNEWVPVLIETPNVEGYPILARLLFSALPSSTSFVPRPGIPAGVDGAIALAEEIERTSSWGSIPAGAVVELKKYRKPKVADPADE
jgi:predicted N-acetyltransferase YhbS